MNLRILVVGCGNMGTSHALAYYQMQQVEIVGLVSRGNSKQELNQQLGGAVPLYDNYETALLATKPDAVCIATYPDTHEAYALQAIASGCHVFIEKPLATTVAGAERIIATATAAEKIVVAGYILRHHPSWQQFINQVKELGKPLVMRMNLNQQSSEKEWSTHKQLMQEISPIVDCGVHYVDVMCQMTNAEPVQVSAIGARLSDEIPEGQYNYGQLQIKFADQSIGWYEAGWGPMMSETAFFIKDVIGPNGSVSITGGDGAKIGASDTVESHTQTGGLLIHPAQLTAKGRFAKEDNYIALKDEPNHQELCNRQQQYFLSAIAGETDTTQHLKDAVNSLRIVLAADASVKSGTTILL